MWGALWLLADLARVGKEWPTLGAYKWNYLPCIVVVYFACVLAGGASFTNSLLLAIAVLLYTTGGCLLGLSEKAALAGPFLKTFLVLGSIFAGVCIGRDAASMDAKKWSTWRDSALQAPAVHLTGSSLRDQFTQDGLRLLSRTDSWLRVRTSAGEVFEINASQVETIRFLDAKSGKSAE